MIFLEVKCFSKCFIPLSNAAVNQKILPPINFNSDYQAYLSFTQYILYIVLKACGIFLYVKLRVSDTHVKECGHDVTFMTTGTAAFCYLATHSCYMQDFMSIILWNV